MYILKLTFKSLCLVFPYNFRLAPGNSRHNKEAKQSPLFLSKCVHNCSRLKLDTNKYCIHVSHSIQISVSIFLGGIEEIHSFKLKVFTH